ncbi:MAG: NADPH:quinone oxidoreductase family protein [Myxococcota bacterium]|nr:NADPH:quinone oxidoreductase family protein [Myxococcota bacterium]
MKAWRVVCHGAPSEALELHEVDTPEPGPGQVRVRTRATACNFNEVDGCHGRYLTVNPTLPYTLGMELVGEVDATGPGEQSWLGRRVIATASGAHGGHAEQVIADVPMVFDAPPSLDDVEAAAFFFPFHVAWLALVERGAVREGENVLVHAGAGGVGSAAVQLAKALGARVLATAGGPEKLELCRELGADVAIDYRSDDFAQRALDETGGRGVDLVCDLVGGEVTRQSFRCIARGGRLMIAGFSGGIEAEDEGGLVPRPIVFGNFSVGGVMLAYGDAEALQGTGINLFPRSVGERVQAGLLDLLAQGRIRPLVGRRAPYTELPAELERMEARRTTGRSILTW